MASDRFFRLHRKRNGTGRPGEKLQSRGNEGGKMEIRSGPPEKKLRGSITFRHHRGRSLIGVLRDAIKKGAQRKEEAKSSHSLFHGLAENGTASEIRGPKERKTAGQRESPPSRTGKKIANLIPIEEATHSKGGRGGGFQQKEKLFSKRRRLRGGSSPATQKKQEGTAKKKLTRKERPQSWGRDGLGPRRKVEQPARNSWWKARDACLSPGTVGLGQRNSQAGKAGRRKRRARSGDLSPPWGSRREEG